MGVIVMTTAVTLLCRYFALVKWEGGWRGHSCQKTDLATVIPDKNLRFGWPKNNQPFPADSPYPTAGKTAQRRPPAAVLPVSQ